MPSLLSRSGFVIINLWCMLVGVAEVADNQSKSGISSKADVLRSILHVELIRGNSMQRIPSKDFKPEN